MGWRSVPACLLLAGLCVACSPALGPQPNLVSASPRPSESSAAATATNLIPVTGHGAATPTSAVTATAFPAVTLSLRPTVSVLASLYETQTAPFSLADCSTDPRDAALSPDGTTLAVVCPQGILKLLSATGAPRALSYGDVWGAEHDLSIGILRPLGWSNDSRYIYVIPVPLTGTSPRLADGAALLRYDTVGGEVSAIVKGADYRQARFAFALSPDGATLAQIDEGIHPIQLALSRIGSGGLEQKIVLNSDNSDRRERYHQAGRILWSPDGTRLVVGLSTEGGPSPLQSEILMVDPAHSSQPVLLETGEGYPAPLAWLEDNTILLQDMLTGQTSTLDVK